MTNTENPTTTIHGGLAHYHRAYGEPEAFVDLVIDGDHFATIWSESIAELDEDAIPGMTEPDDLRERAEAAIFERWPGAVVEWTTTDGMSFGDNGWQGDKCTITR